MIICFPECPNLQSCCMKESLFSVRQWFQEPGVSHHSAALPPALASEWVLYSSDTSPSSKDEVYCGEYLCRILVASAAWMPPPSLSNRVSYFDGWVIRHFMIFSYISSLRGSPCPFSTRLTLLVTSECFVGHSLSLSYLYSANVCSFSDLKNTSQFSFTKT